MHCGHVCLYLWSCVGFLLSPGEVNEVALKEMISLMPLSIPYITVFACFFLYV